MFKQVFIVTRSFYDFNNKRITIGGLQTYLYDLCRLFFNNWDIKPIVFVLGNRNSSKEIITLDAMNIHSVPTCSTLFKSANQNAFDIIFQKYNNARSLFIIASEQMDIKCNAKNVIAIQHGIAFDLPGNFISGFWGVNKLSQRINKALRCLKNVGRFFNTDNMVCVDYNYYNWFKTLSTIPENYNFHVIPNYSSSFISHEDLYKKLKVRSSSTKIIFARRFVDYRGTCLFANVIKRILDDSFFNLDITFAGEGPLEDYLHEKFIHYRNVHFSSYKANESVNYHKFFDIAVVPSIFSEGTSLSLCEAMAAGCFPVATFVGGMSNMIIDGFNGKVVYPSEESLYNALVEVLQLDKEQFNNIVLNAYESSLNAFSKKKWENRWISVIESLFSKC